MFWWVKWAFFVVAGVVGLAAGAEWGFGVLALGAGAYLVSTAVLRRQARARGETVD